MSTSAHFSAAQIRSLLHPQPCSPEQVQRRADLPDTLRPLETLTPASVLVPLVAHAQEWRVLLTQRTDHLHHHGGQICFPGGRQDPEDVNALATALRETWEEIGLSAQHIEIAGYLDPYETITGFLVTPVVGLVQSGLQLKLDDFEVAEVFEVPLNFILRSDQPVRREEYFQGRLSQYYVFDYPERYIWGATAAMLVNLRECLLKR